MKLYADRPGRLLAQLLGDILVVIAVYWAVRLGRGAHEKVGALAVPGREAEEAATALDGQLRSAANDVGDAPLVGDTLSRPFRALASTSRDLAGTAQSYQDTVADVALLTGVVVALVPIVFVLAVWLPRRLSWVIEASAAKRLMRVGPAATELLAVRALAKQPLQRLARLGPEVVTGWKAGDAASTAALASLELDELGLRQREPDRPGDRPRRTDAHGDVPDLRALGLPAGRGTHPWLVRPCGTTSTARLALQHQLCPTVAARASAARSFSFCHE